MKLCIFGSTCFLKYHNAIALDYIRIKVIFSGFIIPKSSHSTFRQCHAQVVPLLLLFTILENKTLDCCDLYMYLSLSAFLLRYGWVDGSTSVADPGCLSRILDPNFFHPGSEFFPSRIRIKKEFKYPYFNPKNCF
jgi:hypothetical protein